MRFLIMNIQSFGRHWF